MKRILQYTPPLSREEEIFLFTQLAAARRTIKALGAKSRKRTTEESSQLGIARQVIRENRSKISAANMPLVLKLAMRFIADGVELDDLIGDGAYKLLQCIDLFQVERGFRFSTYLYRSLVFSYLRNRSIDNKTWRKRVDDEDDLILTNYPAPENDEETSDMLVELREVLAKNKAALTKIERKVILLTLEKTQHEITLITGLSKVKQKEYREAAIEKLRKVMSHDKSD